MPPFDHNAEAQAEIAFSNQSFVFDKQYGNDVIIAYKRERVRAHVLQYLQPGASILELNAGTGEDAVFFARKGFHVHATDISSGMQQRLADKIRLAGLMKQVSTERCSFNTLGALAEKGPYDCIFSNFAGLNCTSDLPGVIGQFSGLLKPGGIAVIVVLPKFCLWELLLIFKGKFRTAFRRFFSGNGRAARIDGHVFRCWYYSPSTLISKIKYEFDLVQLDGLCTIVPPSYLDGFPGKYPRLFNSLCDWEKKYGGRWPWNRMGDYFILTFRKK